MKITSPVRISFFSAFLGLFSSPHSFFSHGHLNSRKTCQTSIQVPDSPQQLVCLCLDNAYCCEPAAGNRQGASFCVETTTPRIINAEIALDRHIFVATSRRLYFISSKVRRPYSCGCVITRCVDSPHLSRQTSACIQISA